MQNLSETITQLNILHAKTKEAKKGFAKAAAMANKPENQKYFLEKSNQKNVFAIEIVGVIRELGSTEEERKNYLGNLHRAWMDMRTFVASDNDAALMEECERGEQVCLEDYKTVLENPSLPPSCRNVLQKQHDVVESGIRKLEEY